MTLNDAKQRMKVADLQDEVARLRVELEAYKHARRALLDFSVRLRAEGQQALADAGALMRRTREQDVEIERLSAERDHHRAAADRLRAAIDAAKEARREDRARD